MEYTVQDTHLDFSTDSTTYKELYGMNKTPDMGGEPEKKEISNMRDKNKRYVLGLQDTGTLGFEFYYNKDKTAEENGVLKNSFSELKKLEKTNEAVDWRLTYPDGSYYSWKGKPSAYILGASVGDPIGFKLSVSVESEMEFTDSDLSETAADTGTDTEDEGETV